LGEILCRLRGGEGTIACQHTWGEILRGKAKDSHPGCISIYELPTHAVYLKIGKGPKINLKKKGSMIETRIQLGGSMQHKISYKQI
jgi:hypothetical protein